MDQNKTKNSRNIPLPIKREVRQRCGFGCVICGLPLYEYEHMEEWAKVQRHVASEITLLCDQHHKEKTNGLLPKEVVSKADKSPYNLKSGVTKPYNLHFSGDTARVVLGRTIFTQKDNGEGAKLYPVIVDNIPVIAIRLLDGHYLLSMSLFDKYNNLMLKIEDNQLLFKTDLFDIQLVRNKLTINEKSGKIYIEIQFNTPNEVVIKRGRLLVNGVEIKIDSDKVLVNNNNFAISGGTFNSSLGFVVGNSSGVQSILSMEKLSRYD